MERKRRERKFEAKYSVKLRTPLVKKKVEASKQLFSDSTVSRICDRAIAKVKPWFVTFL